MKKTKLLAILAIVLGVCLIFTTANTSNSFCGKVQLLQGDATIVEGDTLCPKCGDKTTPTGKVLYTKWEVEETVKIKVDDIGTPGCGGSTIKGADLSLPLKLQIETWYCDNCGLSKIKVSPVSFVLQQKKNGDYLLK